MSERIFLSLGSNLGNREENLKKAREKIQKIAKIVTLSSIYETEPVGYKEQSNFYNQVIEVQTTLAPEILLDKCLEIETIMGRVRKIKKGSRNIDIDILLYGNRIIKTENLILPHPQMSERAFVLVPFVEIAAEMVHPESKETIASFEGKLSKQEKTNVSKVQTKQ